MPLPTERQLLDLWERSLDAPAAARAEALLSLAEPEAGPDDLAGLPLGECERRLLALRRSLLGPRMTALAACPACGERHDVEFDVDRLLAEFGGAAPAALTLRDGDLDITVRPLTAADFEAAGMAPDAESAAATLLERCVIEARRGGEPLATPALTPSARVAIAEALAAADPLADLGTELQCAACGQRWDPALDTAGYLWLELQSWAERLLRDVHALAATYGWTEEEVLRLSPWRRAAYRSLAGR